MHEKLGALLANWAEINYLPLKRKLAQTESERLRYRQMAQQYKTEIDKKNKHIQLLKGELDRSRREIVRLKMMVKKGEENDK